MIATSISVLEISDLRFEISATEIEAQNSAYRLALKNAGFLTDVLYPVVLTVDCRTADFLNNLSQGDPETIWPIEREYSSARTCPTN
jgi:hypothetical protein